MFGREEEEMLAETAIETMVRPEALVEGAAYLLVEKVWKCNCAAPEIRAVQFVGYTSCPGVVRVVEASGQQVRCLRDRLFTPG
jgi:hypothetical protein